MLSYKDAELSKLRIQEDARRRDCAPQRCFTYGSEQRPFCLLRRTRATAAFLLHSYVGKPIWPLQRLLWLDQVAGDQGR